MMELVYKVYLLPSITVVNNQSNLVTYARGAGASEEKILFSLNPNPANDILNVTMEGLQTNSRSTISILDVSGATVKTIQPGTATKTVQLDVSSLTPGTYFIKIISGDKVMHKQFVKMRN
jgi:hypothetical protein